MDNIDGILYINLDHRTDKKEQIENELNKMEIDKNKIFRISGVKNKDPNVGCALAHLSAIKFAKEKGFKNFIVFEDDFEFIVDKETFHKNISDFFNLNIPFRCVMLTYCVPLIHTKEYNSFLKLSYNESNAAGYLVNESIVDNLINLVEFGAKKLSETGIHWKYCIDQIWKQLQDKDWYCFVPRLGRQRESFSDISGKIISSR